MIGYHIIIDIYNIEDIEKIKTIEKIEPLLENIVKTCNLNIITKHAYQYEPFDVSMIYILRENHICIHTFTEMKTCYIDLYLYNYKYDVLIVDVLINLISNFFNDNCIITNRILER